MQKEFIAGVSVELEQAGYLVEHTPLVPGIQALLYAHSLHRYRLGFSKVEDHYLFVDWEESASGRLNRLLEFYDYFRDYANQGFTTPHALRLQIPNLVLAAVALSEFSEQALQFVHRTYQVPWYGGETGQIILIELKTSQVISHPPPGRHQMGAFPLAHAAKVVRSACASAFK